jgi:tRNA-splicing endonuclease subunit Sen54
MFSHLQIIPSGHDRPLPRGPLPHRPSLLTPLDDARPVTTGGVPGPPSLQEYPYQTFFHVYKPVTKFKKSDPPEPDFRMVVIK